MDLKLSGQALKRILDLEADKLEAIVSEVSNEIPKSQSPVQIQMTE